MTSPSVNLPYNVIFNINQWLEGTSWIKALQISKAWNEIGKCFQQISAGMGTVPSKLNLIKIKEFFIVATGSKKASFYSGIFQFNIKNRSLHLLISDSRSTIKNIFTAADNLIIQYPKGMQIFHLRTKGTLKKIQSLIGCSDDAKTRVEAINNSFIILQSIVEKGSHITILNSKNGKQLDCFKSNEVCGIHLEEDILYISRKDSILKYNLISKAVLERIEVIPTLSIEGMLVHKNKLELLVSDNQTHFFQTLKFDL